MSHVVIKGVLSLDSASFGEIQNLGCVLYYEETMVGMANVRSDFAGIVFDGYVRYDHPVRLDLQIDEKIWADFDYFSSRKKGQTVTTITAVRLTKANSAQCSTPVSLSVDNNQLLSAPIIDVGASL